jgi:hypothetical protein
MSAHSILKFGAIVTLVGVISTHANAAALRWQSLPILTDSVDSCFTNSELVLRGIGFTSIRRTPSEVAGSQGGVLVAITCIGTRPNPLAVVMVVSDSDTAAIDARTRVVEELRRIGVPSPG